MLTQEQVIDYPDLAMNAAAFALTQGDLADGVRAEHVIAITSFLHTQGPPEWTTLKSALAGSAYAILRRAACAPEREGESFDGEQTEFARDVVRSLGARWTSTHQQDRDDTARQDAAEERPDWSPDGYEDEGQP